MIYLLFLLVVFIFTTRAAKNKICKNYAEAYKKSTYLDEVEVDGVKTMISKPKCPRCGNKEIQYQIVSTMAKKRKNLSGTRIYNTERAICTKCGHNFTPMSSSNPGCSVWIFSACVGLFVVAIVSFAFAFINLILM